MSKRVKREESKTTAADEGDERKNVNATRGKPKAGNDAVKNEVERMNSTPVKVKTERKERKAYELPGQKHDPLDERDPLRIFYESCYKQLPNSEMAQIWMMEYGLLDEEEASRVFNAQKMKKTGISPSNGVKTNGGGKNNSSNGRNNNRR